jgi:hypothetical protein
MPTSAGKNGLGAAPMAESEHSRRRGDRRLSRTNSSVVRPVGLLPEETLPSDGLAVGVRRTDWEGEMSEDLPKRHSASPSEDPKTLRRRQLLKILTASGGALAGSFLLPGKWGRPLVELGYLPAHARASPAMFTRVYWTEQSTNRIRRANLDGSSVEDVATGLASLTGIDLDLSNGRMYLTFSSGSIRRANLDGSNMEDVITGLSSLTDVALGT